MDYNTKSKEELKNILRAKKLMVGGVRDELIDRLEKADSGQTILKFSITVPPNNIKVRPEVPSTPKRRRFERENSKHLLLPSDTCSSVCERRRTAGDCKDAKGGGEEGG